MTLNCKILSFALLLWCITMSQGYLQYVMLYEGENEEGNSLAFTQSVPDIGVYPLRNISSFCIQGFWAFMDQENYVTEESTYLWDSPVLVCENREFSFKSMRRGGGPETGMNAVSLFSETLYNGQELFVDNGLSYANISMPVSSLIWTGFSSWTIFEEANFQGTSACLHGVIELGVQWSDDVLATHNLTTVGSIFQGCFVEKEDDAF